MKKLFKKKFTRIYKSIIVSKILQQTGSMKLFPTRIACKTEKKGISAKILISHGAVELARQPTKKKISALSLIHFPLNIYALKYSAGSSYHLFLGLLEIFSEFVVFLCLFLKASFSQH